MTPVPILIHTFHLKMNAASSSSHQYTPYQKYRKKMADNRINKYNSFRNPIKYEVRKVQQNQRSVVLMFPNCERLGVEPGDLIRFRLHKDEFTIQLHYFNMIIIYFRTNEEAAQIQKGLKITFKLPQFTLRRKIIKLQKSIATGLSMPRALKERIDIDRGDIPRSRFILRILEKTYGNEQEKSGAIYDVIHPHSQVHATPDHLFTDKTEAVRDICKHYHRKNKLALQSVGKPSDNANNRVSSTSKEGSQEG